MKYSKIKVCILFFKVFFTRVQYSVDIGLLWWLSGKEPAYQCRKHKRHSSIPGWEDPLEEGMATHSSILAWRIPWTEEPGGLQSMELQWVRHDWSDLVHTYSVHITSICIGKPKILVTLLQYSFILVIWNWNWNWFLKLELISPRYAFNDCAGH